MGFDDYGTFHPITCHTRHRRRAQIKHYAFSIWAAGGVVNALPRVIYPRKTAPAGVGPTEFWTGMENIKFLPAKIFKPRIFQPRAIHYILDA